MLVLFIIYSVFVHCCINHFGCSLANDCCTSALLVIKNILMGERCLNSLYLTKIISYTHCLSLSVMHTGCKLMLQVVIISL